MIARFFIDRPIFASVVSIVVSVVGGVAAFSLPVAQYPHIVPPTVQVSCQYPGAASDVVADTVAAPIEQQVNGVEGMLYMSSRSADDGRYTLTVTFELGTNLDAAMVQVQNRVSLAIPQLPEVVQAVGVDVRKKSPNMLLAVNFISPDSRYDDVYVSNYATIHVVDEIARIEGVGGVQFLGQRDYGMRVWLDPDALAARDLTANEVVRAIQGQNAQVVSGRIGGPPTSDDQSFEFTATALGRLRTVDEFERIVVKSVGGGPTGTGPRLVHLADVARVELGARSYSETCTLNGQPSVAMAVYQRPGANALHAGRAIRNRMEELADRFPEGLEYRIVFDTTPFVSESIREVFRGLRDAIVLVALVVLLFLQNWRAATIPLVAVPVALLGTFGVMAAIGYGLNTLSLFGLVLAIGIVVDDAIVVVENVQRFLEQGLGPREATRRAMDEVTGPIVAIALVLSAVFVPCIFVPGITGEFFRQFGVTIAVSMIISALNSLTLSPALAALLLRPKGGKPDPATRLLDFVLGWAFRSFDRVFAATTHAYVWSVHRIVRTGLLVLLPYLALLGGTWWTLKNAPSGFIPIQDKGWLLVDVQLPDSASQERTSAVMSEVARIARATPGVAHTITVAGQSFVAQTTSSNYGTMFVILEPFEQRRSFKLNGLVLFLHLRREYPELVGDALVRVFPPPPVNGLGATGGFQLMVEDRDELGPSALETQADRLVRIGSENPQLAGVSTSFRARAPRVDVEIDRTKARAMGVSVADVSEALQVFLGASFVDNFNAFGRTWQVDVQAEPGSRSRVDDVRRLQVRNDRGEMVPLAAIATTRDGTGPPVITRFNLFTAAEVNGRTQLGVSSGKAIEIMSQAVRTGGPYAMKTEWSGLSLMQIRAGDTAIYVFGVGVVFVFLVLAALYESWTLPLAIILVVPLGLLFSVVGVWAFPYMDVGIFTQIGFLVLVGLACKNAILIVEFAESLRREGRDILEATHEACRLRLRPIVMTSMAFVLGVVPLIVTGGAGAEMRRALGVAVFAGMIGVTLCGLLLTPAFYVLLRRGLVADGPHRSRRESLVALGWGVVAGTGLGLLAWRATTVGPLVCLVVGVTLGLIAGSIAGGLWRSHRKGHGEGES